MAPSAAAAPAPTQTSRARPVIPAGRGIVPAAVVLAVVVAALSLLPSVAQAMWEVPHLLLLGLVISYGVFAQHKNNGDAAKDDGARAWSSQYHPDDPLVVVAPDHAAGDDGASVRPFSLPVRRLKPVVEESEAGGASDDGGIGEETDSSASTAGFWAGAPPDCAAPTPPSVLDAFDSSREFTAAATPPSTAVSKGFPGYDSPSPRDQSSCNEEEEEEEEGTDWDEDADGSDDMTAPSSEMSFPGDFVACRNRRYDGADGDGESEDEELIELATQAGPAGVDEVDRKADEFIAKFREQIRLQRSRPRMT
uniref:Uncharacterized protein n=1 Tax=Avena sativa TaxID=4498 RepID=A0ACD5YV53_AVESA